MRLLRVLLLVMQALVLVEAAKVRWTLHKSCYRNKEDTEDDNALADAMVDSVQSAKSWARRAASKISDSATKVAISALLGSENYATAVKDVKDKFKKLADLDGPIGQVNGDRRYDKSKAWIDLENSDDHHFNFIFTCRPEVEMVDDDWNPEKIPFDVVRKKFNYKGHDFDTFRKQEDQYNQWKEIPGFRIMAITQRDSVQPPAGGRRRVPETINFHPLWIKYQKDTNFGAWTEAKFNEVTATDAPQVFRAKGVARNVDVRPIDGLLSESFIGNILHEFFHLTYFGAMLDDDAGAYGWANNIKNNNRENPDLFAIIGTVIELMNRDGQKYDVSKEGNVVKA